MASKIATDNRKLNISDCMADKTEIQSDKNKFLWSRHALKTKLIAICCPIAKFAEIFKMAFKTAADNRKLNISDSMADKTEIPSAKHAFLWSRHAFEITLITMFPHYKIYRDIQDGVQDCCRKQKIEYLQLYNR